ncbi:MAG TPA: hypothetical protein VFZ38_10675 [Vicinamibacterales bacterium]
MRTVAALCVAGNSVYKSMPWVEAYDARRDARTFPGGMPVVAHPPCRLWSAYTKHQAKSDDPEAEKALGLWCASQVRRWGGVLEQPAHSGLWEAAGLPTPGSSANKPTMFSIEVSQAWWGYPMLKATWLYFHGVEWSSLVFPMNKKPHDSRAGIGDRRRQQVMSKNQRAATYPAFAEWLVAAARSSDLRNHEHGSVRYFRDGNPVIVGPHDPHYSGAVFCAEEWWLDGRWVTADEVRQAAA